MCFCRVLRLLLLFSPQPLRLVFYFPFESVERRHIFAGQVDCQVVVNATDDTEV